MFMPYVINLWTLNYMQSPKLYEKKIKNYLHCMKSFNQITFLFKDE